MNYTAFLTRIIDDGIAAATADYKDAPEKLRGALAGFEACRGKSPIELAQLLADACKAQQAAYHDQDVNDYWCAVCYAAEIEWACNCLSAAFYNEGLPTIVEPTARGVLKAAEILGVGEETQA